MPVINDRIAVGQLACHTEILLDEQDGQLSAAREMSVKSGIKFGRFLDKGSMSRVFEHHFLEFPTMFRILL